MTGKAPQFAAAVLAILISTTAFGARPSSAPQPRDIAPQLIAAGVSVEKLQAFEIGGVVVLRGRTTDRAAAERAGKAAQDLGYSRVANLIQVVAMPDDEAIERLAEREIAIHRQLDGAKLRVASDRGIVHVSGDVQHELQKDAAVALLRNIDGVKEVRAEFNRR